MALNVYQQTFALSLHCNAVNKASGTQANLQATLRASIAAALPRIGAGWTLAWGPAVHKQTDVPGTGPDNSWYIASHPALTFPDEGGVQHPAYVVAIAGAPENSSVARDQTQKVNTVTDFSAWVAGGIENPPVEAPRPGNDRPYIAAGTVNTVHLLLNTPAPENSPSPGQTLLEFIARNSGSGRFIFTGHGLGGTLSPALALALVEGGKIPSDSTLTYPTAGASPGNVAFADLFSQRLSPRTPPTPRERYRGWNLNLANSLDIMSHAWPPALLTLITLLYGGLLPIREVAARVEAAIRLSTSSGVSYKSLQSLSIIGIPPIPPPTSLEAFKRIAFQQHVGAYISVFAFPPGVVAVADGAIVPSILTF